MVNTLLSCHGLSAGYDGSAAIRDVEMEVQAGQIVVLAGRNGAGKTTTLMTLAGAIRPLEGQVNVRGQASNLPLHKRVRGGLGLVTERRCVVMGLSVEDNLRIGSGDVESAFRYFPELEARRRIRAGLLSGGEQQMLVLARVFAANPDTILVDELSQGLAPRIVRRLLDSLKDAARSGVGVLLVEQHVRLALQIADYAYFLRQGRIYKFGSPADLDEVDLEAAYM